jgi:uncharacterized membrane protein
VTNFLPFLYFKKPFWLLIFIFAVFRGDTHQDNIYGHNVTSHDGIYGHFLILPSMAHLIMAITMVLMGVPSKNSKNSDQQPNGFLK